MMNSRSAYITRALVVLITFLSLYSCSKEDDAIILPDAAGDIELWEQEDGTMALRTAPIANATSYTWYLDDRILTSTTEPVYQFSESGEYMVAGTNSLGTGKPSLPVTVDASGRPGEVTVEIQTSESGVVTLHALADKAWGYRWFLNDELMQRGPQSEYLPLEDGKYTVQPYNASGNGQSIEVEVKIGTLNLLDPRVVPDEKFRQLLISMGGDDTFYSTSEAETVTALSFQGTGVSDITGIRFFTNLVTLNLNYCSLVKYLDLRGLTKLETLELYNTEALLELNISGLHNIRTLNINSSAIGTVDLSGLTESLETLNAGYAKFEELDFTSFKKLKYVNLSGDTRLTSLKVKGLSTLETLIAGITDITSLDLSGCTGLKSVVTSFASRLTSLTLPESAPLEELKFSRCGANLMPKVDLTPYRNTLKSLFADVAGLKENLVFENYPVLEAVQLDGNSFSSLSFKDCPKLKTLRAAENSSLTSLTLDNLPSLNTLYCYQTGVTSLDFSSCRNIVQVILFEDKKLTSVNFDGCSILSWISLEYAGIGPKLDISATDNIESFNCEGTKVTQVRINKKYDCSKVPFSSKIPKGAKYVHEFE